MRARLLTALTAAAAALTLGAAAPATAAPSGLPGGKPLQTALEPGQEIAPFVGVAGASGSATLRLNPGQERICVDLRTEGLDPLALAHIHEGARGTNGPVVVDFTPLIEGHRAVGCVDVDRALVRDIVRDPSGYYVNTHRGLPGGDAFSQGVRGQLG